MSPFPKNKDVKENITITLFPEVKEVVYVFLA